MYFYFDLYETCATNNQYLSIFQFILIALILYNGLKSAVLF
ncbi:protein of unknown function [Vibrio tapetis subsp. tapetis]|uniref:Uncharacterized protein n=1 Tax=Vibrio tapetis subsp. tapetis TaxID=1671868 RepID=A0A2N8ZKJ4_9VIBR|nr:protein of unknown function [Vibrio tapetis subsp. tapetis]